MLSHIFIKKPLFYQYLLSAILDTFILIFCIFTYRTEDSRESMVVVFSYFLVSIVYYWVSRNDWKYSFPPIELQIKQSSTKKNNFWKYLGKSIFYFIKYTLMLVFLLEIFKELISVFSNQQINLFFQNIIIIVIVYFTLSKIFFIVSELSPVILFILIGFPIFLASIIGVEKSFLGWTFITLILSNTLKEFTNTDLKYVFLDNVKLSQKQENSLKRRLIRAKYWIISFIPFLYLSLVIFEKVIYTEKFSFLLKLLQFRSDDISSVEYFSDTNLIISVLKLFFILVMFLIFEVYRVPFSRFVKNSILLKLKKNSFNIAYGKYTRVKKSFFKKKYRFDSNGYYIFSRNCVVQGKSNWQRRGSYKGNRLLFSTEEQTVFKKSRDHLVINGQDFIREKSKLAKKVIERDTFYIDKKLKKVEHSILVFPLIILVLSVLGNYVVNQKVNSIVRGDYIRIEADYDNVSNKYSPKKITSEELEFTGNQIYIKSSVGNEQTYEVDKYQLVIKGLNKEIAGKVNINGVIIFNGKKLGENQIYILKTSDIYKKIEKELKNK